MNTPLAGKDTDKRGPLFQGGQGLESERFSIVAVSAGKNAFEQNGTRTSLYHEKQEGMIGVEYNGAIIVIFRSVIYGRLINHCRCRGCFRSPLCHFKNSLLMNIIYPNIPGSPVFFIHSGKVCISFIWNMSNTEWILRPSSIDEIGCIHTTQGYDLNYVGVIFGEEIDYDQEKDQIIIDASKHYDFNVQRGTNAEDLKQFLINSYKVMMSRGIKGCYVYVCNPSLREYLSRFIPR